MYSELLIMIIGAAALATATMLRQQLRREFIVAEVDARLLDSRAGLRQAKQEYLAALERAGGESANLSDRR